MNDSLTWKRLLRELGFTEKPRGLKASHWIMEKDGFEVEFSTSHLWENENKNQKNITDIDDLAARYKAKTNKEL